MTRKLNRNYSLSIVAPFVAILTLLIAAAVLAQTSGAGPANGKANAVLATAGTTVSAQAEHPLTPWTGGAGDSPVGRLHTKRQGARPLDANPLFLPAVNYSYPGYPGFNHSVGVADVNGDGKPDLVVAVFCASSPCNNGGFNVLLGNGDGTFQTAVGYLLPDGQLPIALAIADVNGDGKPDLVMANWALDQALVLLGNGDGTFQPPVTYGVGGGAAYGVAVGDVNRDGKLDVIVTSSYGDTDAVGVLLGNGDGTFQAAVLYNAGPGSCPDLVAIADVNGDGNPDLLVTDQCNNLIAVLLGNGDGTFQAAVTYSPGGTGVGGIAVADLNGDNKWDIVVVSGSGEANGDSSIGVLLGNGDGTFQPAVTYDSGGEEANAVAVADVNSDGTPDLLVVDQCSNGGYCQLPVVGVLIGNGDGTFQPALTFGTGGFRPTSIVAADVNGDANPDLVVANAGSDSLAVLLNNSALRTPTTATLASSPNPSAYGQAVTFTATVSAASGTPTGTVVFSEAFTILGSATLVNGSASISVSSLAVGSHSIISAYQGSLGFQPSTSAALKQVVNPPATTTTLFSSLNPSVFGQAVSFTAAVSSASGTPTGTVIFYDGSTAIGSATLANGIASLSTSSLAAGSHSITAAYQGSSAFGPSTSAPLNQVVNPAITTTSLVSSANPARVRQSVTYTATVTSQYGGAATGAVTFQDGGSTIATVPLANNQAAYNTTYTKGGSHAITATYSGDVSNLGSTSAALMEYIESAVTKTVVTTSGSPSFVGQPVTFTATVTSTHGTIPDGELVTFFDGKTAIGTGATASGVATFVTSSLKAETHTIKAAYPGDDTFEPSSGLVKQVVDKYPTTTTLSSSPNPSQLGQTVTFTATVTSAGPTPTGKVEFKDGTKEIKSVTLSGGVATLTTSKLAVGSHSITAEYTGDDDSAESTSPVLDQVVQ